MEQLIRRWGFSVEAASDGDEALAKVSVFRPGIVLTDLVMPKMSGLELLRALKEQGEHTTTVILTAQGTVETAVQAIKEGAYDYLTKPVDLQRLRILLAKIVERHETLREVQVLRRQLRDQGAFGAMIGNSPEMRKIYHIIEQAAPTDASVLISGESGTGKELVAQTIHRLSPRGDSPYVPINCAAIPETLLESELFGYVRGAFTDARKDRSGLFREANGGMLFLDEISELPLTLQSKLLRVLEDKEVRPLGANQAEKVDTRVLSASNRNLEDLVRTDKFRQDLYYRLNVIRIELPPLRHRGDDVPLLVQHFVEKFAAGAKRHVDGIEPEALAVLKNYDWPGNIRELEHTIERAVLLGKGSRIELEDLPRNVVADGQSSIVLAQALTKQLTLRDLEREYVAKVLDATNGNKTEAAKILGVDRTTLYRKLEEYKLKDEQ